MEAHRRGYTEREWDVVEAAKREHWARELATEGPDAAIAASQALWAHMRRVRPDWPSERDQREDLAHHVALKRAIDRSAGVFISAAR